MIPNHPWVEDVLRIWIMVFGAAATVLMGTNTWIEWRIYRGAELLTRTGVTILLLAMTYATAENFWHWPPSLRLPLLALAVTWMAPPLALIVRRKLRAKWQAKR